MATLHYKPVLYVSLLFVLLSSAFAGESGIVTLESKYSAQETADRFEAVLKSKGMNLFAKIDFSALGKKNLDLDIPFNQLFIFGKGTGGPKVISASPVSALDFPLKVVVWEDKAGKAWLSYSTAEYIKARHKVEDRDKVFGKIGKVLETVTSEALK